MTETTELSVAVVPPAGDASGRQNSAGEVASDSDGGDALEQADRRMMDGNLYDGDRDVLAAPRVIAQLPDGVVAPAAHGALGKEGARVAPAVTRGDPDCCADPTHRDRGMPIQRCAVAELAVEVVTPAADGVVGKEGAGVIAAGTDRRGGADA